MSDILRIGDREFTSRLILGSGKYSSDTVMQSVIAESGCEIITVALRRVDVTNASASIVTHIPKHIHILPNTSGAASAEEAVRIARLSKAMGMSNWVKLEVTPDPNYLLPDGEETLKATQILVKEGFTVLPYINADPILAKKLTDAGAATVMPLAAPIGSNRGLSTIDAIRIIVEQATVPVIVDAGIGKPSDAARALELGVDAVMINTAIAVSPDPPMIARAFKYAVEAGRTAFRAGLAAEQWRAQASSPLDWL